MVIKLRSDVMKNYGEWIARHRVLVLVIAILLAIPSAYNALNTELNYDILSYLPDDVDSIKGRTIMNESFDSATSGFLVFKGVEEHVILDVEKEIEEIEGIKNVVWARDVVDVTVPAEVLPDKIREVFYTEDAVLLMVNFTDVAASDKTLNAIVSVRETISDYEAHLAGASMVIRDVRDLSAKEKDRYIGLAVLLATIVLALTLPSTVIPFIFLTGIGFGVLYNLGTNFFLPSVSYVTSAIAGVLQLAVTMDFSIMLYHRFEEERLNYTDKNKAMGIAIKKTATAIGGAAITTIAGFLALTAMKLGLGANIGLVMAKGVFLGVICTLTIMPALLLVFDKAIHRFSHPTILPEFRHISNFVVKHHIILVLVGIALLVPAIYGSEKADVYYNLDKSLPRDMDSIVAFEELKEVFDMKSFYSVAVDKDLADIEVQEMIKRIEDTNGIKEVLGYQKFMGPMIPIEMLSPEMLDTFRSDDFVKLTIMSKYSAASDEGNAQADMIKAIVKEYDEDGVVTGEISMTKDLIDITEIDTKVVNRLTIILLLIIVAVSFKSLLLPVILVMSIELAVFINMGIPYYTGTTIPFVASIIIGSVQLGTTVDYAILLTNRYREELFVEANKKDAMRKAIKASAKSIITSALAFFGATFAVFAVSNMDLISTLTLMMGRGALVSMVIILTVLPALLLIFEPIVSKTTIGWKKHDKESLKVAVDEA